MIPLSSDTGVGLCAVDEVAPECFVVAAVAKTWQAHPVAVDGKTVTLSKLK